MDNKQELVVTKKRGRPRLITLTPTITPSVEKIMAAPEKKIESENEINSFQPFTTKEALPAYPKDKHGFGVKAGEPRYMLRRTRLGDYDFLAVYRKHRGVGHRLVKALKSARNSDMAMMRKLKQAGVPTFSQFGEREN